MKTTTTTREYDSEGRLVKEIVSEVETPDVPWTVTYSCTCGTSVICAQHQGRGWWQSPWICWSSSGLSDTAAAAPTFN